MIFVGFLVLEGVRKIVFHEKGKFVKRLGVQNNDMVSGIFGKIGPMILFKIRAFKTWF